MISDGIYEQIINQHFQDEIDRLNITDYDIELKDLNADDARKILTIYISSIIQKGLRYVREDFHANEDEEALLAQIQLCNDIIDEVAKHSGEADFDDYQIMKKGEVLTSLYHKINTARSIAALKTVRPETSLVEATLFTGARQEPSMLSEIKKEIVSCDRIDLLVSFIKWSAIRRILPDLRKFTTRPGASLRIITTTYMKATDYKAVAELSSLPNTQIKINYETGHMRMHAKSYLFHRDTGFSTAYIGSSNLSNPALTEGLEWNMKVTEQESFDIIKKFAVTFETYWNDSGFEIFDENDPSCVRKLRTELSKENASTASNFKLICSIRPYPYQEEILEELRAEREVNGFYKNLVVGSTGVGKTAVAAFDYKRYNESHPGARLLFVAHRKEILQQSMRMFREVLNDFNFGDCYVDGLKPAQIDHLFMSIQSFNASNFAAMTTQDFYDYIVVDEFHHAAAKSYKELLTYYQPKILLGLTATPDRMDGKSILGWFDGRIAAELRLPEAIDRKLLCPFQYFGITDDVDYSHISWKGKYDISELENIYTADTKRADLILNSVNKYVTDINDVKGLGFCISVRHAEYMAKFFSDHDVPSISLSSKSDDSIRDAAKEKLTTGQIRFIFVVDLYNEGVDIPSVNTILFLRPTESATVFLQQLGRGLRLCDGKECLTVLDFVGQANKKYNFETKFRAMTGTTRKPVRYYVENGFSNLPRGCYIYLEKQAQDYVLRNLKEAIFDKRSLTRRVASFEEDTGLTLTLEHFLDYYKLPITDFYVANGSRNLHRLELWADLLENDADAPDRVWSCLPGLLHIDSAPLLDTWISYIEDGIKASDTVKRLMINMLYYTFFKKEPSKEGFADIDTGIQSILKYAFVKAEILQILKYQRSHIHFVPEKNAYPYPCPLQVHCHYNTRQIMAAYGYFNETTAPEFREGVKYIKDKNTDIFLINLNKSEKEFSPSTMYDDYAINSELFHWQSQSTTAENSETAKRYIHHRESNGYISLFVREFKKNGNYTAAYTFLGNATYVNHSGSKPVSFTWKLDTPMPANLLLKANKSVAI
ncbi:MAG: DUF3427 domain-containing protein [Lachnospiraceae bacterium]|nr:DUF3427 domain-containing protein [Lachnospiraceae bacterium]